MGQESSDEEEEESEEEQQKQRQRQRQQPQRKPPARPQPRRPQAPVPEESEDDDEEGFVTEPEDEDGSTKAAPQSVKATSTPAQGAVKREETQSELGDDEEDESGSEEESEEEEGSSEEESSTEEEEPRRKFQRPTFIKRSERKSTPAEATNGTGSNTPRVEEDDTHARRLAQAEQLIKDKLERDALARAQGRKAWDDDDDVLPEAMVDDTDGVDPEAEYAAWKVRELKRLKRDREALIAREKELEEIERRRNLTAEEREKEDREFLEKQREERESGHSKAQFLARYHHKGAFFQGDEAAEFLKRRDVMGAQFEDQVSDKSTLPEYMRLRDMTKLGKKGRTRYTDLKGQDTGQFGEDVKRWKGSGSAGGPGGGGGGGGGIGDVDERFLPDDQRGGGRTGPSGANATAVAPRQERNRGDDGSRDKDKYRDGYRDRRTERDGDRYKKDDRSSSERDKSRYTRKRSYSASRSRSRSPQRRRRDADKQYWDRDRARDRVH